MLRSQGMISLGLNVVLYGILIKSGRHDFSATEEQMSERRLNVTAIGCVFLAAMAIGELVLFGKASAQNFAAVSAFAFLASYVCYASYPKLSC